MLRFKFTEGYDSEEDKEYLIWVEAMSIIFFDRSVDEDVATVAVMII